MTVKNIIESNKLKFRYLKSIHMQILIYISVLVVSIVLILYAVFYYLSYRVITKDVQNSTSQITEQIGRNIEYYVNYMKDISYILNDEVLNYNATVSSNGKEALLDKNNLLLKAITQTRSDINSIFVFKDNTVVMTDTDKFKIKTNLDVQQLDWYKNAVEANGNAVFSSSHVENLLEGKYPWVVSLSKAIYDKNTNKITSVALININFKVFTDMCSKVQLGNKGYVFIFDDKGNIVYHPKQELIYSNIKSEPEQRILDTDNGNFYDNSDGTKKLITVKSIHSIGWKVIGVTYMDDILIQRKDYLSVLNIIILLCLVISVIISAEIASNISDPLSKLEKIMKRVETGEMDVNIEIKGNNETVQLAETFSIMVRRIKVLLKEIEDDKDELRKSEMKTLYSQINPHFLYNSLDTIIWAAEQNENEKVVKMTSALAKFFRLSLSKGREVIRIYQEVEHIKNYLIIQKIRYDEKLQYEIDVDQGIMMFNTLKTLMQPLVENAIYHGIKNQPSGGKIWVYGKRLGNEIHLTVKDDGPGMDEQQLSTILTQKNDNDSSKGGVGTTNVHQRIQLYYGSEYGLRFKSKLGEGTEVTIVIPIVE